MLAGCREQSEMVLPALMEAVASCARRRESVVVEGVHLSVEAALQLMHQHHPSCWVVPFLVYISNESKHLERFAVRARYMALTAAKNRYVHFFQNIRTIQADLGARADAARLPKIDNTNVDRSVAMIHDVTLAALREAAAGGTLLDGPGEAGELTAGPLLEEYERCLLKWPWGSKRMIETLRERGALKGGDGKGSGEGAGGAGDRGGAAGTEAAGAAAAGTATVAASGEAVLGALGFGGGRWGRGPPPGPAGSPGGPDAAASPPPSRLRSHSLGSESPSLAEEETDAEGGPLLEEDSSWGGNEGGGRGGLDSSRSSRAPARAHASRKRKARTVVALCNEGSGTE